jgi:hypothetical protein
MLSDLILTILCGMGLAILLVEKGHTYPMRYFNVKIRRILRNIAGKYGRKYRGKRPEDALYCVVCTSFWTTLLIDVSLCLFTHTFLWPLSGFATAGITYIIFTYFEILEKK